ncbi:MAG: LPP20 family lipoprotein [bacterium]
MKKVLVIIACISIVAILFGCATTPERPPGPPVIRATGLGAPPPIRPGTPPGQVRLLAERAAKADAYRNLLERVKGVRVEGETTVQDFVAKSDIVRTRVDGVLRGARVISSRVLPDKTYEVILEVRIADLRAACKGY